ncbi:hypothetical protein RvVAT039_41170 [Agrobacterium vitis]|nr:hypothetical protein RvVAT039_41170 [Agrobacterium vitis]
MGEVAGGVPPSALPGISPSRGEIDMTHPPISSFRQAARSLFCSHPKTMVAGGGPPSALPGISPSRGEIDGAGSSAIISVLR